MNVLYIHQYFVTPSQPGGTRSYWISKELIKRGNHVIMITSTSNKELGTHFENVEGIDVFYIYVPYSNYMGAMSRIKAFVKFMFKAIWVGLRQKKIDMVFATSTPLTVGAVAIALKWLKGWKYVFEVRDLWPEGLIQEGITNPIVVWCLRLLEKMSYHKAEHVIALSPGMREGVLKVGTKDGECTMIPNMSKPDKFFPRGRSESIIQQFGLRMDKFNLIHFGAMGFDNYNEYIIEAAKLAHEQNKDYLNFLLLGDGSTLPRLKEMVSNYHLNNVQFIGKQKMDIVSEIVNCCDATITSFRNIPILATNSPNKLFDSLSAGKPVIVNSNGWTKELVEKENCGCYVDPEIPQELVDVCEKMRNDKSLVDIWGQNSRRLSLEVFDKKILSSKVADVLEMVNNRNKHVNL